MLRLCRRRNTEDEVSTTVCALPSAHTWNSPELTLTRTTLASSPKAAHVHTMQQSASQLERVKAGVASFVADELGVDQERVSFTVSSFFQTGLVSYYATVRVEITLDGVARMYKAEVEDHRVTLTEETPVSHDSYNG